MKTLLRSAFMLVSIVSVQFCYSQEPVKSQDTKSLRAEALKLYGQKKYEGALKIAQQIVQIKEKELGAQHLEVAGALSDVATIEIASGKIKNGEKTLRQAIAIYESKADLTGNDNLALANMFEVAGFIKFKDEKPEEAIREYRRALEIKEKNTGTQSLETAKTLWQLGNMYLSAGDYQNSYEFYERVLKIRSNNMNWLGFDEVRDALQRYECTANKSGNAQRASQLISLAEAKVENYYKQTVTEGGVVNGKAKKLVRPPYPSRAASARLTGSVEVQVTIDETGTVIFACAKSGHPIFHKNSEEAALGSKFAPTMINGKPVKITGIIVYNFGS